MPTMNKNGCTFLAIYGAGYANMYCTVEGLVALCRAEVRTQETEAESWTELESFAKDATMGSVMAFYSVYWIVATDPKKDTTGATWEDFCEEASLAFFGNREGRRG